MITSAPPRSLFLLNDKFAPCLSNNVFPKNTPVHPTELGLVEYIGDKGTHENIYMSPHKGSYSSL